MPFSLKRVVIPLRAGPSVSGIAGALVLSGSVMYVRLRTGMGLLW